MISSICFSLLMVAAGVNSANILVVIPFSGKSHYYCNRNIGLELARRGHDVYVITSHTEDKPPSSYREIVVEYKDAFDLLNRERPNIAVLNSVSFADFMNTLHEGGVLHSEWVLKSTEVQKFISENHTIDLVISEVFIHDSFYMFSHHFNAPLVLVTTFGFSFRTLYLAMNPIQISTVLHEYGKEESPGSFWGRLKNLYYCAYEMAILKLYYLSDYENVAKKHIPNLREPVPSLEQVTANASLILINSHFSVDITAAYLPNVVEVGGLHIEKLIEPLPRDLKNILDSSQHGVILVSFGSFVKSKQLPTEKLDVMLSVFRRLKQNVIFKWEDDELPGKPDNVEIRKWLPQKEILAHPNVKLFIGHGGLIGLQEATYYGVPVLGVPIFADQLNNILQAKELGYAEILPLNEIDEDRLEKQLKIMLQDDKYVKEAKKIAQRFKDRPMSALNTAIYWIEYVIRYNGAPFFKSPGLNMNVIAYYMLDIALAFIVTIISIILLCIKVLEVSKSKSSKAKRKGKIEKIN